MNNKDILLYDIKVHNKKLANAIKQNDVLMIEHYEKKVNRLIQIYNKLHK